MRGIVGLVVAAALLLGCATTGATGGRVERGVVSRAERGGGGSGVDRGGGGSDRGSVDRSDSRGGRSGGGGGGCH
jgi:hypothetical protein